MRHGVGVCGAAALAAACLAGGVAAQAPARAELRTAAAAARPAAMPNGGSQTPAPLPPSSLSLRDGGGWREWWTSRAAPAHWDAASPRPLAASVRWQPGAAAGVEWGELAVRGSGEAWRTRVVVARVDPRRVTLRLDTAFSARGRPAWRVERADPGALLAVNAGQFIVSRPWGWVLLDGDQFLAPEQGPLASTLVVDSLGRPRLAHGAAAAAPAARAGARWAFQSYPTLLDGGRVPAPLQAPGRGVDVAHRDARAAIGLDGEGRLVVALTRFDGAGDRLGFVPFGLTTPEMAAVMGALGCVDAVMLDGGISAQLRLRTPAGVREWSGLRPVPLALVATARR